MTVETKRGDRVRYVGKPYHESGAAAGCGDLLAGDEGNVVDVAPDGSVVVAWFDGPTIVNEPSEFERLATGHSRPDSA